MAHDAEARKLELDAGWLGRFIGSKNAPNNMAFLIVFLAFTAGFVFGIAYPNEKLEFWKLLAPFITLTIGYVFGKNSGG